ncbi:NAPDH-dependent diflavin reductase [Tilletia horrida]|uniref:NAPDH-dependent diflavin reductase n=1 Tax=Tilletia horrida TaxID=155126 RepID=A0AAN6JX97_9BASI|nr:NAPDH-dependent diflavin reductase [Tilletia horrida]
MSDSKDTSNKEAELAAAEVAAILAAAPTTGSSSSAETASIPASTAVNPPLISREGSSSNSSLSSMQNESDQNQAISALTALGDLANSTLRAQTAAAADRDDEDDEEEEGAINEDSDEEEDEDEDAQGDDDEDEDEDEEMADAVELSVPGGTALAPTNSGMGSSTTSLSDDDSLSVLSSPSSEAGSLPDEDGPQPGPSGASSERQQRDQEGTNVGTQDAGQQPSYDDDEQEEEGEVPDDGQDTPRARSTDATKSGDNGDEKGSDNGDYGDTDSSLSYVSDVSSDGGRDDTGYGGIYNRTSARGAVGSAAMMTESPGGTPQLDEDDEGGAEDSPAVRGDLSGSEMGDDEEDEEDREEEEEEGAIGSPASNAETEPLPFDDAQQPAQGAGEGEDEAEEGGQQEEPTPTTGVLAGTAKDDRDEVASATPQEAMEALTRIEIQFALLRDRRYVERMEEICRESEMVLEGTHPELIRFTKAIDQLKERKLRLLDMELQKQVAHYEQAGEGEEQVIWNSYRYQAADLRQNMMDDTARKRRRLEREKRLIDAPRPARRHQTFETELVPNPDRQYAAALRARKRELAIADATAAATSLSQSNPEAAHKAAALVQRLQENAVEEDANDYVAYPEVKGLDETELWTDLDRMGILGYGGPGGPLQHYYAAEELQAAGLDDRAGPSAEVAGGGPESGYPYAPTEASLHGYPVPDHDSVGGGAGPSYSHHGRGDRQMADEYGPRGGGPPGGEIWPGHFAGHSGGPGPGSMEAWQAQQQQLQHHQLSPPPQQQPQQPPPQSSRQHPKARMGPPPQQMQYRSHVPPTTADGGMEDDRMRGGNWGWE